MKDNINKLKTYSLKKLRMFQVINNQYIKWAYKERNTEALDKFTKEQEEIEQAIYLKCFN